MPGVLQLEAMAQVAGILLLKHVETGEPDRLFHVRRKREMAQAGRARRHADHRGGADEDARQNRQGQGRLQGGGEVVSEAGSDFHACAKCKGFTIYDIRFTNVQTTQYPESL